MKILLIPGRMVSELIERALIEMRQREARRALIALGGSDPNAWAPNEGDETPR